MEEGYFLVLISEEQLFSLAWGQVVCFLHTHLHTYNERIDASIHCPFVRSSSPEADPEKNLCAIDLLRKCLRINW